MTTLFIRTIILYIAMVTALRLMGKRQIGELQPSELVVSIAISDLASIPMQDVNQPLLSGLIPILTLMSLEIILSFCTLKSRRLRKFISGTPGIIIENGVINQKELARMRYNLDDLAEELRTAGYGDVRDVAYAVLETNGMLNIIPVAEKRPVTPSDLAVTVPASQFLYTLISDGQIIKDNLNRTGKSEAWLKKELSSQKIFDVRDVFYAALSGTELIVQKRSCVK